MILNFALELILVDKIYPANGFNHFTGAEANFFNAYKYLASKNAKPLDINVSQDELVKANWIECYLDLKFKWPEVVSRFSE